MKVQTLAALMAGVGLAGSASAAEVLVTANISTSTTWTANNTYNLQQQIYVLPGATLTIEPGTIIASDTNIGGSLAITRGAQIIANGTRTNPIIFTSKADVATWVGGNPKTGTWRAAANEWGNLTLMGSGYISENAIVGNTPAPSASNVADMEGLTNGPATDRYGGGNDDDDSGSLAYVSLRYNGKVVGLNNELNGLALGGVGRQTDIHHIDIMNGVDDGIEIWGGTVNLKYLNIWNVGDDSVDVDQGWRGKMQFGLIVQGYSLSAPQGSGVGDNIFETDGAEQSDYQPVTTSTIYNFTAIGQPGSTGGDHGTAWRDNCRMQYRNCIFMDVGDRVVSFDNVDGDGGAGYGFNGTLSWANTWTTAFNAVPAHANDPVGLPGFYSVQTSGNLAEITDSVFFRNLGANAYTEANARGVFNVANNNVQVASPLDSASPIRGLTRGAPVPLNAGALTNSPVLFLDPRPQNDALTSVGQAPNDGFFTPAQYRGAFAPGTGQAWVNGWTASFAYGFTPGVELGTNYCFGDGAGTACPCGNNSVVGANEGCLNSLNVAGKLRASGKASLSNDTVVLSGSQMTVSPGLYFQGTVQVNGALGNPFGDGLRCAGGAIIRLGVVVGTGVSTYPSGTGVNSIPVSVKGFVTAGQSLNYQLWYRDSAAFCSASTFNLTNAVRITWEL